MKIIILIIIYLAFAGYGLHNSLLGSAWPIMQEEFAVPLSGAGIISIIFSIGMIVSSLFCKTVTSRFGTGKITLISLMMTASALLGYWILPSYIWLFAATFPLGLGSGTLNTILNNFVALYYKSSHMNWLHCFWGIGATIGPIIMSVYISQNNAWRNGYFAISMIQFSIAALLLITLPLWNKMGEDAETTNEENQQKKTGNPFMIAGVKMAACSFFFYFAIEGTMGLWGSSYLITCKNIPADIASGWLSMYFIGITIGRFAAGIAAIKLKNNTLIRFGLATASIGSICLILPVPILFSTMGLLLIGLGCAPVLPCMIQETPRRFGERASGSIMGIQMAFGFIGCTLMPPVFGLMASKFSIIILPLFIFACILIMLVNSEAINKLLYKNGKAV